METHNRLDRAPVLTPIVAKVCGDLTGGDYGKAREECWMGE